MRIFAPALSLPEAWFDDAIGRHGPGGMDPNFTSAFPPESQRTGVTTVLGDGPAAPVERVPAQVGTYGRLFDGIRARV